MGVCKQASHRCDIDISGTLRRFFFAVSLSLFLSSKNGISLQIYFHCMALIKRNITQMGKLVVETIRKAHKHTHFDCIATFVWNSVNKGSVWSEQADAQAGMIIVKLSIYSCYRHDVCVVHTPHTTVSVCLNYLRSVSATPRNTELLVIWFKYQMLYRQTIN